MFGKENFYSYYSGLYQKCRVEYIAQCHEYNDLHALIYVYIFKCSILYKIIIVLVT